tara:strand:- start:412 stop:627 length:216 start_codon:yes stop_codon:yes gene_type:complete
MSTEKIIYDDKNNLSTLIIPEANIKSSSGRVDINNLLARVRKKKATEFRVNLIFFGLIISLVFIVGLILSF